MKYTEENLKYLRGEVFSAGYNLQLDNNLLYSRIEWIKRLLSGKSVLHIGCCDHLPLIEKKIYEGKWLHGILDDICSNVIGIDVNQEAVDFINKRKLSKNEVHCLDISDKSFAERMPKSVFDFVLLGEILEHVDNPVDFLFKMKTNLDEYGFKGKYLITVPNAFCFQTNLYLKGIECVNSDHKYWFTPYTLAKVLVEANITPEELLFASYGLGGNGRNRFQNKIFSRLERFRKRPSSYKSYRGETLIIIGV